VFPRPVRFDYDELGLATLNFVPSIVTMVIGSLTGQLFRSPWQPRERVRRLLLAGAGCVAAGYVLGHTVCPLIKPLWTPSWAVFSAGFPLLVLAALYWTIDVRQSRRWTYPLVVLGVNSLFVYLLLRLMSPWMESTLTKHFTAIPYSLEIIATNVMIWIAAAWLHKRKLIVTV